MPPTGGGGGGGGGLSTVTTDSSLTGNGTAGSPLGLLLVSIDTTLTGAGISSSHLGVNAWPVAAFTGIADQFGANPRGGANQVSISGFELGYPLTFAHIAVDIGTTDGANNYDFGVYTKAGALVANIGATTLPSGGVQSFATLQGPLTIAPGLYVFAWTGNAATATLSLGAEMTWIFNQNVHSSAAGVLPGSIGALTAAPGSSRWGFVLF